ncbi:MAG: hypothetical protein JGK17_20620 [Microcoleus sp. PH2017_10_PVI_O_A]|uniref:hypothetical protein n=1 Tax=unclassified Microcoleus TaxID=2642155 RepID=UPI001D3257E9|nr:MULTISPECIES: hypothetical protein [unclassified Microcoleus]MCC3407949.1 hypothetical protein [Microcoleus sp. PH2017_10_PVI_O_A]MCC3462120.1 hypothetical protein [Microcoleus sp. PH2017_11_PCY_U_A]MCC3480553.1 hypothetical protein [Microcoleus sp. PH2017_12_PCY_D_A]MCC3561436.1 hypothetical protein [Microcoleus sp. PH2017_27_LUM_O_A]
MNLENTTDLQGIAAFYEEELASVTNQDHSQIILITDAQEPSLVRIDDQTFWLKGHPCKDSFVKHLRHILYTLSESSRQTSKSQCTIHAAAVSIAASDDIILILGDKGSGKTITAYALCHYHSAELVGNDLVILGSDEEGKLYLHGGTTSFTMRRRVAHSFFPDIAPDKVNFSVLPSELLDYESKMVFNPSQFNISVCTDKKYIGLVVRVNVHTLATANSVTKSFSKQIEALRLHENFARYIRGQTTPLSLDGNGRVSGYFPSFDSLNMQTIRNKMVSSLLKSPFFYVTAKSPQESATLIMETYAKHRHLL